MVSPRGHAATRKSIRHRLEELEGVVSGARRALILMYGSPDPDSLASAWALRELIRRHCRTARIRYTGEVGRLENQTMIESLRIPAQPLVSHELAADLVALVDCQPEFFAPEALPRCDVVIDHHPRKSRRRYAFSDIRPKCLATSSILTEYLRVAGVEPNERMATALFYGIQTDASHLQRPPSAVDIAAIGFLEPKVGKNLLRRIQFSSYSLERLDYFTIALVKLRYANGVLYSHVGPVPYMDICAQIADFLIRVKEARWALTSGVAGKTLIVVLRCDGHHKHAGKTAELAFGKYGSAGGHRTTARAEVNEDALPKDALLTRNETIEQFVLASLSAVDKEFRTLCNDRNG
ncbi:MAG: DHH family phosphoesterase [Candidatus Krumholzibacteria bacterium]|nr:DHH family phosphoesterase [Candidatus Krumholzibacteria bacterium]